MKINHLISISLFVLSYGIFAPAQAQKPVLVKDINAILIQGNGVIGGSTSNIEVKSIEFGMQ